MSFDPLDPVSLLQALIRCPSVTPHEGGALALLEKTLTAHGFTCHRLTFSEAGTPDVENLYARWGTSAPHLCFAGHTDVVPAGDTAGWSFDPFGGEVINGEVCGRGAADMKGPTAAFISSALRLISEGKIKGSLSFLITGDEEGPAINGTRKVLDWLAARGEKIDFCLVGEPTSREKLGDMIKVGRRGTLTGYLTVNGTQGHVAYPDRAGNPIPRMIRLLSALEALELDQGSAYFQPSNLEIVTVDTGNSVDNLIPAQCRATFNIRFNDHHTGDSLSKLIRQTLDSVGDAYSLDIRVGGESFYTEPAREADLLTAAISEVTGRKPELSTSGGTSDARFIRAHTPVLEFGIVGTTMHKVDERVSVVDMTDLAKIYSLFIDRYLS